jgi:hydrogenase maturation factor
LTKSLAIEGTALLAAELGEVLAPRLGQDLVDRAGMLLAEPGISVLQDARTLLDVGGVTALHDVTEGGLVMAVREIAAASELGAELDGSAVPVLPETAAFAAELDLDPLGMLGSGSLLGAAAPDSVHGLIAAGRQAGFLVTDIGYLREADGGLVIRRGSELLPLPELATDEVSRALNHYRTQAQPGGKSTL